nr:TonB-dependent receptor [Niabella ginsengisoli]
MGYNGSNRFAKGRQYQLFPSVSAGWIISNEKFLSESNVLNFLKLRGSFGQVGNDKLGGFSYYYRYTYVNGASYSFGETNNPDIVGLQEGRLPSISIGWEMATKYNVAFETRWLKSRLSFNVDLFKERRTDILAEPGKFLLVAGINSLAPENIGVVNNKGYDLELGWQEQLSSGFSYFAKAIYSNAKNTIAERNEANQPYDYLRETGRSIGQFLVTSLTASSSLTNK